MMRVLFPLALAACAASAAAGCKQKRVAIVDQRTDRTGEYGKDQLEKVVGAFLESPRSPESYRVLSTEIDKLRPSFNQQVADVAERHLAFLALDPLASVLGQPPEKQMDALAVTVWPVALNVLPEVGEKPRAYVERACNGPLGAECKYVVPEHWPTVLSAIVWRRMKSRAREAFSSCRACSKDPSYKTLLERYDQYDTQVNSRRALIGDRVERKAWPEISPSASPWSNPPLLDLALEPHELAGQPIDGDWGKRLVPRPAGADVLGVHLRPRDEVRQLRAVLQAAAAAGYKAVALQARHKEFPYALGEYRVATRGAGDATVTVRDVDTIQVLVRALDAAAARAGGPARAPVMRLRN
jgi:hypothetical protein